MKVVSIHQPQYMPWLPYFLKIERSDTFILLDSVDFQKNGLQNRNQIKTAAGAHWLTVPVLHAIGQRIVDVQTDGRTDWRRKHWQTIKQNYSKAEAFKQHCDELEHVYAQAWPSLNALNAHVFTMLMRWLGIERRVLRSSEMRAEGSSSTLVLNLCLEAGATRYLSGTGAKNYLDEAAFSAAGVELVYLPSQLPSEYPQAHASVGFINTLSALDILLCCGADWRRYVRAAETA